MDRDFEDPSFVRQLITAVAIFLVSVSVFVFSPPASAQFNGVPASVTSIGFGGHFDRAPGVPASVTSFGFGQNAGRTGAVVFPVPNGQFFNEPDCCINPLFPRDANPPRLFRHHHHHDFFPAGGSVFAVPYAVPYPVAVEPSADEVTDEEDYRGGPTIFDRRGPGERSRRARQDYADSSRSDDQPKDSAAVASQESPADQPETVLVYKDGHQDEIQNYAVVGEMLYDLSPGHRRKIALADLDLAATVKQNDDRGIDFRLPPGLQRN
jgi:hypothetical protein